MVISKSSKYLETPAMTVVTSMGNNWAMWDGQSLRLMFVGEQLSLKGEGPKLCRELTCLG